MRALKSKIQAIFSHKWVTLNPLNILLFKLDFFNFNALGAEGRKFHEESGSWIVDPEFRLFF